MAGCVRPSSSLHMCEWLHQAIVSVVISSCCLPWTLQTDSWQLSVPCLSGPCLDRKDCFSLSDGANVLLLGGCTSAAGLWHPLVGLQLQHCTCCTHRQTTCFFTGMLPQRHGEQLGHDSTLLMPSQVLRELLLVWAGEQRAAS